ncbi:MAG: hypothetical protein ACTSRZ_06160 [Promethearchaeota archaeon]
MNHKKKSLTLIFPLFFLIFFSSLISLEVLLNDAIILSENNVNSKKNNNTNFINFIDSSTLDNNDIFSDKGKNLLSNEFAQSTNSSQSISNLDDGEDGFAYIDIPPEWTATKLRTTIYDLSDNITWEQNGGINGQSPWVYDEVDFQDLELNGSDDHENCWGYYAGPSVRPAGTDTGALFTHIGYRGPGDWLNTSEYSAFNQTIYVNRSDIEYCAIDFDYYNGGSDYGIATGFVEINGYKMTWDAFSSTGWKHQNLEIPTSELPYYFSLPGNVTIKIGIDVTVTAVWSGGSLLAQELYFDNISLYIRAKAYPSHIGLKVNGTNVIDVDYGEGYNELSGTWPNPSATQSKPVIANITTNSTDVNLKADLTLSVFRQNVTQDSNGDSYSEYSVANGQSVNWTTYYYGSKPPLYKGYNFTLFHPSDWNAYSAIDPIPNEVISYLIKNPTNLVIPTERANDFPGLWKIQFNSPNYVIDLKTFKNTTAVPGPTDWSESNSFFPGEYINITAKIKTDGNFTDLINTNATLMIKFPNGTIWNAKIQSKQVQSNSEGFVHFNPFQVPSSGADYIAGKYKILVLWNNSYSGNLATEAGLMKKSINIIHHSKITPEQIYYNDKIEGSKFSIKVQFNDSVNADPIRNAVVYFVNLTGQTQFMTEIAPGYYFAETTAAIGSQGENTINIYANHTYYENISISITVEVVIDTKLSAAEYPSVQVPWNENLTIHLNYTEKSTSNPILSANFTTDWTGESFIVEVGGGLYNLILNTSSYSTNSIQTINISTSDIGYNPIYILIDIQIIARESSFELFLNQINKTDEKSIEIPIFNNLNITFKYLDVLNASPIPDASVILKGTGMGDISMAYSNGNYEYQLDTGSLGVGIHSLNITATSSHSSSKTIQFIVDVKKRAVGYELYLNSLNKTASKSIEVFIFTHLNISLEYYDAFNGSDITDAQVMLKGVLPSDENLSYSNGIFQYDLDVGKLGVGTFLLSIEANHSYFQTVLFDLTITVKNRETNYTLYLNSIDKTIEKSIEVELDSTLNISFSYFDDLNGSIIQGASVNLIENTLGIIPLAFSDNLYQYQLDTAILGTGVYSLQINAKKNEFDSISVIFILKINKKVSNYTLFLNGSDYTKNPSFDLMLKDILNISIKYFDNNTQNPINPASVEIYGIGAGNISMTYSNGMYEYILDTTLLGGGVHLLNIIANSNNYSRQSVYITLTINPINSSMKIFINGQDITLLKTASFKIREVFNLSIDYFDNLTLSDIQTASVNISGIGTSPLMLVYSNGFYQVSLNTSDLGLGIHFITIIAEDINYTRIEETISIKVEQIVAEIGSITNSTTISGLVGKSVEFGIYLLDSLTNKPILGANVSYSSSFGTGYLTDEDNDGYYTTKVGNLSEGTYKVYISVDVGADYKVDEFSIILNIVPESTGGNRDKIITASLLGGIAALSIYILSYQFYLKYPPNIRSIRKIKRSLKKEKPTILKLKDQSTIIKDNLYPIILKAHPPLKAIFTAKRKKREVPEDIAIKEHKEGMKDKENIKDIKEINKSVNMEPEKLNKTEITKKELENKEVNLKNTEKPNFADSRNGKVKKKKKIKKKEDTKEEVTKNE